MSITMDREGKTTWTIILCQGILPYPWKIPWRYGRLNEDGGNEILGKQNAFGLVLLSPTTGEYL